jgi:hypothetical protein
VSTGSLLIRCHMPHGGIWRCLFLFIYFYIPSYPTRQRSYLCCMNRLMAATCQEFKWMMCFGFIFFYIYNFFLYYSRQKILEELETASEAHAPKINKIIFSFTPLFIYIYLFPFLQNSPLIIQFYLIVQNFIFKF